MAIDPLVVVGTSLGGVEALQTLAAGLPADFPAPILVVQHIGSHPSRLPEILSRRGPLAACHAADGDPIVPGRMLLAPPDRHMLVDGDAVTLTSGPKEHHARPAIDPLFLSAALMRGPGVIGVILTGRGQDGTAGLQAIKSCGGIAVIQHPEEAIASSMPRSASIYVDVDHRVGIANLPKLLQQLVAAPAVPAAAVPPANLVHELRLTLSEGDPIEHLRAIGKPSPFVCPECSGGLWELNASRPMRFRCHTGHGYTLKTLQDAQSTQTDAALWSAIRALQERGQIMEMLASSNRESGEEAEAARFDEIALESRRHADLLRELVEEQPPQPND
jgi:two-component system chemotaxis response regulator CheB